MEDEVRYADSGTGRDVSAIVISKLTLIVMKAIVR
jgi:hypothetical protein